MGAYKLKTGLSKDKDIPILYIYLIQYEKGISNKSGEFNIDSESFKAFCKKNDIKYSASIGQKALNKKSETENYFFFSTNKNKDSGNDKAHHLLRHIRNSIAHALVKKDKNRYYLFTDLNTNKNLSMDGKIRIDLFESFIIELLNTQMK